MIKHRHNMNSNSPLPLPPGGMGLPIVGETLSFFSDSDFAKKKHQKYGQIFKTSLLGNPTIFLKGVEANQFVLTNENKYFVSSWPPSTQSLLGSLSLAVQTGHQHQSRRKLLAQAFLPRALSSYTETIESITKEYALKWQSKQEFAWYSELRCYTLDIACKLFVGIDHGSDTDFGKFFDAWCAGLFSIAIDLPWTTFGKAKSARQKLLKSIESIILERQNQDIDQSKPPSDALGMLMAARDEEGKGLSLDELKDQILVLLFAGHETLTSAICSFCQFVAQYPAVREKLIAEQNALALEGSSLSDSLKQMTYLEAVLKEVMRLVSPVAGAFRKVIEPCEFNGYQIPKGWNVLYGIQQTHLNPEDYVQPDQFNPERFEQPMSIEKGKYGYLPFGGGIRECVGKEFAKLEMKLFAIHMLQHYEWELLPNQDLSLEIIPSPRPKDKLKVRFYPKDH